MRKPKPAFKALLAPLTELGDIPSAERLRADEIPPPYRALLVHQRDMTSTLEEFHRAQIHLRVLTSTRRGNLYHRKVVLAANGTDTPVEFGAIRIHLDALPPAARRLVLDAQRPLGSILKSCRTTHASRPQAFFRVRADAVIRQALGLKKPETLYGRCNELRDVKGRIIATIVEILPTLPHFNTPFDCIVVGGGPAGSTAAAVLAMRGRRVLLLEREKFPRYHIGESLMPFCYFPLARIGMIEKMKHSAFPRKYSVQFVRPNGEVSAPFYFFQHLKHPCTTTWQVARSDFDQMLLDNAREKGVAVLEQRTVKKLLQEDGAVVGVRGVDGGGTPFEFRAPMTIDATGRDGLAQISYGWRARDPHLNKIALWTYYKGARRDPGLDEGATTVAYLPHKGWFWYIPLPQNRVSVGIVAEAQYLYRDGRDLEKIFLREMDNNLWIKQHLSVGRRDDGFRVTGEFSYRSRHCAADGLVLAGDAFAFLDPVFSSGVFLALRSGEMAADAVDAALTAGDVSAARFEEYGRELCRGIEAMRKLVYAFYDEGFSFKKLITTHPQQRGRLTDCLIGDLFGDFDDLFAAVAEFAQLPPPLPYGQPRFRPSCASSN